MKEYEQANNNELLGKSVQVKRLLELDREQKKQGLWRVCLD
jgi:hypothetical protein